MSGLRRSARVSEGFPQALAAFTRTASHPGFDADRMRVLWPLSKFLVPGRGGGVGSAIVADDFNFLGLQIEFIAFQTHNSYSISLGYKSTPTVT